MRPRRIILADGSRFLRDILRKVFDQTPGLEVVAEVTDLVHLTSVLQQTRVEWIVLCLPLHSRVSNDFEKATMKQFPSVQILGFYINDGLVSVESVDQHEKIYGGLTWDVLLNILLGN
jgi:DNA-binding NarL/FixJ family response regulator